MKRHLYSTGLGVFVVILAILSCNLPAGNQAVASTPPSQVDVQLAVLQTLTANAILNMPVQPVQETPSITASATEIPSPTLSPTPSVPLVTVSADTNCRTGPGKVYDYLGALLAGEQTEVVGWDGTGEYWYVKNPDKPGGFCWLWGYYATVTGNTSALPVYTPQPTPTQVPAFVFSYDAIGIGPGYQCLMFDVKNTGDLTWESYTLSIFDHTQGKTAVTAGDDFIKYDQWCTAAGSLSSLSAGESGTASVTTFLANNPAGDHIDATLTLCSENGQSGQCLTQTISFTF
jgi:uncharacterized protein YgiM (DUF1202 family)